MSLHAQQRASEERLSDSLKAIKSATLVASKFAETQYLGTGGMEYVTRVQYINPTNMLAIIGQDDDSNAYTCSMKKLPRKGWVITQYEYIFEPTGVKTVDKLNPPFPLRGWNK